MINAARTLSTENTENVYKSAVNNLFSAQHRDGYWAGQIYFSQFRTAVYIILHDLLQLPVDERLIKAINCLLSYQRYDGSWGITDTEGEADIPNTKLGLLALKLAQKNGWISDLSQITSAVETASKFLANPTNYHQLPPEAEIFYGVPIFDAYYKLGSWEVLSHLPFELFLLPDWLKLGLSRFSVWSKRAIIPILVISGRRIKFRNPVRRILRPLWLKKSEQRLLETQSIRDGTWFTFRVDAFGALALKEMGYTINDERLRLVMESFHNRQDETGYVHNFYLQTWDTTFALLALEKAEVHYWDHRFKAGVEWLLKSQQACGGWAFRDVENLPPDYDDTALAVAALSVVDEERCRSAVSRATDWLLKKQNKDGGWAAFSQNLSSKNQPGPIRGKAGFPVEILDPSTADITGHVLLALGKCGFTSSNKSVKRAVMWLKNDQMTTGSWYGRWSLCYLYGTYCVIDGLRQVGESMQSEYIQKAVEWVIKCQNPDGGWGETYKSYYNPDYAGIGSSTAEHTSWALLTLLRSGIDPSNDAIINGIIWLLTKQNEGKWTASLNAGAIGVGKYANYAATFPLMALSEYLCNKGHNAV